MSADLDERPLNGVEHTPFPAPTKQAAGLVRGTHTDVSSIYFADKIMITISQGGRLSQWVRYTLILLRFA
jgi:proteasome assembly chaperone 3